MGKEGEQPVDGGAREIAAQLIRIVGLDFDAFTKAVILPQGEFDEFLRGESADRRKILEVLLHLGVYRDMMQRANARHKEKQTARDMISEQLQREYLDATPENRKILEREIKELTERDKKFEELKAIRLGSKEWIDCPSDWRAPFLPASTGAWATYPKIEDLFVYNGSGVQPKRTWVIAPDADSLVRRWQALIAAPDDQKEHLFHATLRDGQPADRHVRSVVKEAIPGFEAILTPLIDETGPCVTPVEYGFRSFNRQWIIPDGRVITQHNADLWRCRSSKQVYLTGLSRTSPSGGPALTFSGLVPDLDHYKGSFGGRVFPLWSDKDGKAHNFRPKLLSYLNGKYQREIGPEDVVAYIAALAAHPGYTQRFEDDLSTPGLRIPLTADEKLFAQAVQLGRKVIWLHTFGERMADEKDERPPGPPRLPPDRRPSIPKAGAIPTDPDNMPDSIGYDAGKHRLLIRGYVENVEPGVWGYEVSGKQVLTQWFSYRKKNRERPIIGDRRPPSPLGDIHPDHWLPEYTTELLNVLNVLGLLVDLEPAQAELLDKVCSGPLISADDLSAAGALELPPKPKKKAKKKKAGPGLFDAPAKEHAH